MKRVLGIDYGSKRVGIAVSNEDATFALPFCVLQNSSTLVSEIMAIAKENGVEDIVMGESKDYKGKPNPIHDSILALKRQLEDSNMKVFLEPEFMTSMQAERFQGKHDKLDASAAAIILQSYLDKHTT